MSDCSQSCANPCATCPLAPRAPLETADEVLDSGSLLREAVGACLRQSARDAAAQLGLGPESVDVAVAPDLESAQPAFIYRITVPIPAHDARFDAFDALVRRHRLVAEEASCLVALRGELTARV